ncbi:sterile alpha motif domain-containing protein 14-like isoform X4 [Colius striatus]|uniref:sterile alpha motif domain-containing protein 14-like isoform X4 n=2 Tax=Colius striatus TaxID=57412 RepID=UPI002B1CF58D|nr:sterile alpha motif domain-containing protein 14-like isoform X4 [Colius striatus]
MPEERDSVSPCQSPNCRMWMGFSRRHAWTRACRRPEPGSWPRATATGPPAPACETAPALRATRAPRRSDSSPGFARRDTRLQQHSEDDSQDMSPPEPASPTVGLDKKTRRKFLDLGVTPRQVSSIKNLKEKGSNCLSMGGSSWMSPPVWSQAGHANRRWAWAARRTAPC